MITGVASPLVMLAAMGPNMSGMEYLSGAKLGAAAAAITTPTFAARDVLMITGAVGAPSASSIPRMQFNGDTATNYWNRHFSTGDVLGAALSFTNTENLTQPGIAIFGAAATTSMSFLIVIMNRLATTKPLFFAPSLSTGSAATTPNVDIGAGEWINTTAQITSIAINNAAGATYPANSGLSVYGRNFP